MEQKHQTIAKRYLDKDYDQLSPEAQHVVRHVAEGRQISRRTNREFDQTLTFGQRLADRVASFGGSWTFIIIFMSVMLLWAALNSWVLIHISGPFDPFPYIFLNLILSMLAAIQAPLIMMSQNRQAAKDRLEAEHDYQVNLKAELEISRLHTKMDDLKVKQMQELMELQAEQIRMLKEILAGK